MSRPAPRRKQETTRNQRRDVAKFFAAVVALFVLISLLLDTLLAWPLRARLAELRPVPAGQVVRLQWLGAWDCRALNGELWWLPILPQTRRLEFPHGLRVLPGQNPCGRRGYSTLQLIRAE